MCPSSRGVCRTLYFSVSCHVTRRHYPMRKQVVVDQIPPLTNLHRTLEELSISGRFTQDVRGA